MPGKIYGEHVDDLAEYQKHLQIYGENFAQADGSGEAMTGDKADELSRARPHANLGPKTHLVNGVLVEDEEVEEALGGDTTPPPEAARDSTPELWTKGSDVFRMVAAKIESKTSNVAKLFRKFDIDGDGTVDYRELRKGLADVSLRQATGSPSSCPPSNLLSCCVWLRADGR